MSRNLTARLVICAMTAMWVWALCGCQSEAPAPIQGDIQTADKNADTGKPGGATTVDPTK